MTLNAIVARILRFFHRIRQIFRPIVSQWLKIDLQCPQILSLSSSLPLLAKTITHPAARSLCDSWTSCLLCCNASTFVICAIKNYLLTRLLHFKTWIRLCILALSEGLPNVRYTRIMLSLFQLRLTLIADIFICPIAIAYSMGQIIESVCVYVSVCLSVCPSASTLTVASLDRFSPKLAQT